MEYLKEADLIAGMMEEDRLKIEIEQFFNVELKKTGEMDEIDFIDGMGNMYEARHRRNKHNYYISTMIPASKIKYCKRFKTKYPNKDIYFVFGFSDGDYYWKYDINTFLGSGIGGREDRGYPEIREYNYLHHKYLTKL